MMNATMEDCIDKCNQCRQICLDMIEHCKSKGGKHADPEHLKLLADCAKICETAADFMERDSDMHAKICALCAEICDKCADSCETMMDDDKMKECAAVCRECAEACREMTSLMDRLTT